MKKKISLVFVLAPAVLMTSCGLNQETGSFGDSGFDPLIAPGTRRVADEPDDSPERIIVGSYVEVAMPNTNFFEQFPVPGTKPKSILAQGAALQIIGEKSNFYIVRQVETGLEGYVVKKTVSNQPVLPDSEVLDPAALAVLEDGIEVVNPDLPPVGSELAVDDQSVKPTDLVTDDGVSGGAIVTEDKVEPGVLVEDNTAESGAVIEKDDASSSGGTDLKEKEPK